MTIIQVIVIYMLFRSIQVLSKEVQYIISVIEPYTYRYEFIIDYINNNVQEKKTLHHLALLLRKYTDYRNRVHLRIP